MKKILFWSAVTVIAAVSCNKLENDTPTPSNAPAFEAYVDGAESKTVIDGMASYWDGTERIWVLNGQSGNAGWKKAYKATASKATRVTFKEENNVTLTGDDYLAVYPAEPAGNVTWDGNVSSPAKKFWLKPEQSAILNSYDPSTHIAIAYTTKGKESLEFKNVTALVKFNLTSDNVTEVCFFAQGKEILSGNFDVTYNNGNPTYSTKGTDYSNESFAKIKAATGKTLAKGTYYISVLPCKLSKGFCIETLVGSRKGQKFSHTQLTLKRGQILDLGDLSAPAALTAEAGKVYLNPGNDWRIDNARFAAYFYGDGNKWVSMTRVNGQPDIYECTIPAGMAAVIFCRMNPSSTTNGWGTQVWGQTIDLSLAGGYLYTIATAYDSNNDNKAIGAWSGTSQVSMLYLKPTGSWIQNNERYAAYFFGNGDKWVDMVDSDKDGIYEVAKPTVKYPNIIYCRMNGSQAENKWGNKWDQTSDLTIPSDGKNLYTIGGSWSKK